MSCHTIISGYKNWRNVIKYQSCNNNMENKHFIRIGKHLTPDYRAWQIKCLGMIDFVYFMVIWSEDCPIFDLIQWHMTIHNDQFLIQERPGHCVQIQELIKQQTIENWENYNQTDIDNVVDSLLAIMEESASAHPRELSYGSLCLSLSWICSL